MQAIVDQPTRMAAAEILIRAEHTKGSSPVNAQTGSVTTG